MCGIRDTKLRVIDMPGGLLWRQIKIMVESEFIFPD